MLPSLNVLFAESVNVEVLKIVPGICHTALFSLSGMSVLILVQCARLAGI